MSENVVSLSHADCLVHRIEPLSTHVHNICTGAVSVVPHGIVSIGIGVVFGLFLLGAALFVFRAVLEF